jgi:DNA replication licensing factor MCM3
VLDADPGYFTKLAEKRHTVLDDAAEKASRVYIGFDGNFGSHLVNPRTLIAEHLGHLVAVEGIVTRCSVVRPKMVRTVHYCPATVSALQGVVDRFLCRFAGPPWSPVYQPAT